MSTLRVAATQFALEREESVEQFLAHLDRMTRDAAVAGAELVVFPELTSTGLLAAVEGTVTSERLRDAYWSHLASATPDILDGLVAIAREHQVTVLGGSHIRKVNDAELRNTAFLVHPDGRTEYQDKIHLTPPEIELGLAPGDDLLVAKVGGFTVGVLICADIQFPELSRILVDRGVNLILCPSLTWNTRGAFRVRTGSHARAIENQLYVVMSPLIGTNGLPRGATLFTKGQAIVTAPVDKNFGLNDGLAAMFDGTSEGFAEYTLDLSTLLRSRHDPEPPGLSLRRPEVVDALVAKYA